VAGHRNGKDGRRPADPRPGGLSELVRDTTASFYDTLDDIEALDPAAATVVADDSPRYRSARLWLESTYRKTAVPIGDGRSRCPPEPLPMR
jgi:hypothetical protein